MDKAEQVVKEKWRQLYYNLSNETYLPLAWLAPLVLKMQQRPRIGQLFPVTSHADLGLSRTTQYPYSLDCPHVEAVGSGQFRVYGVTPRRVVKEVKGRIWHVAEYDIIGVGDADEAIAWIEAGLPQLSGPAIDGNIYDLQRIETP